MKERSMQAKLTRIHHQALEILATIGIRLHHPRILATIREYGVSVKDRTALFPPDRIMEAVGQAPASFTLHARNPDHSIVIGGDQVNCTPGYGSAAISDPAGRRRPASMADYLRFAQLVHQSPQLTVNGGILVQPSDIPVDQCHLLMLYAAMLASDKCLLGVPGNALQMQAIMEMGAIVFGGQAAFASRPHILTLISTLSPLQIDAAMLDAMWVAARHRQPLIISPSPAAGTTGPIDMAANISLAVAEALAAIAIVQMIQPGTPVIFGLQCLGADLRTGNIAMGSPAYTLQSDYTAALARMYRLPCRCGGTLTNARHLGAQSGYESMLNMLATLQNRVHLVVHAAGTLDNVAAMSYEKFIVDLEMIDMARYYLQDLAVDDDTLNLALIRRVGPGGQFINTKDTLRKCRTHAWTPSLGEAGLAADRSAEARFRQRIVRRQQAMLAAYAASPPAMGHDMLTELDAFLVERGIDRECLTSIRRLLEGSLENATT